MRPFIGATWKKQLSPSRFTARELNEESGKHMCDSCTVGLLYGRIVERRACLLSGGCCTVVVKRWACCTVVVVRCAFCTVGLL